MIYNKTPVDEIRSAALDKAGIRLLVKREDQNHPFISGNKWWKLKYNIEEALKQHRTVLTFGGAYSNHIYAVAAAAKEHGLSSIGIIRGEETLPPNATLSFAKGNGMQLHYVSREDYRKKNDPEFVQMLHEKYGEFYLIPEGGTNSLAVKGCAEFASETLLPIDFDHLMLPVGTGGTMAGIVCGLQGRRKVTGVAALKNGDFLKTEIDKLIRESSGSTYENWSLLTSYHHGGYAKVTNELLDFMKTIKTEHDLPLDHVYTGKLLWAVMKEIDMGQFARGTTVLALHTGGLQGSLVR
ncbi:1-aminocyclopropane-1-carboxylate deaminase/D-cysteine desulfhydrase [Chryseosolibacter histidini]|uniref:1-aminocyclopropane-1-carboxylate deaminase/D-cysteine desulfhydrase n=1 Tax=Chryseosolibacter histidini TaxID=2782349 RepID=UPI0020B4387F|nr:pyridoxal-phosphate dependent enzyme [Chryseosolibacter histidini]